MKINMTTISTGTPGTFQTLEIMRVLAKKASQSSAFRTLVIQFPTIESVDLYVRSHFRYMEEPYEIILSPDLVLQHIQESGFFVGDCDDVATFIATIYKTLKIPVRLVAIRTMMDDPNYLHVFVEIRPYSAWVRIDPTIPVGFPVVDYGRMVVDV